MKKYFLFFIFIILLMLTTLFSSDFVIVRDMIGREVKVPLNVERIITTYKPATQFVFALNEQDKLVGVDDGSSREKLFSYIYPEIKNLTPVGSKREGVNIETIASLHPDVVILFPHNEAELTASKLEQLGIASFVINPESLEQIRETNILLGKVLGLEEKARIVDEQFENILNILQRTKNLPNNQKKVIYFANSELLDTVGEGLLQNDMIELAGGINPAAMNKKGFVKISPEQLIVWNPDMVVTSQLYRGNIDDLLNDPKYRYVNAFKNKEVYRFPSELEPWDFPSPSSYLGMLWLAINAHPDLFTDIDYEQIVNDFYYTLYGISYNELLNKANN
ncbi:ABC transporter substrate-binding protein [Petrotoga sp. 9PW.55.5.1]|uniref:ABC transporter substrate-binding protein n=1 Tax=Petrotoga sp. 9PW.55.5.1 TaxID=1308979 RepID=UPI000DC3E8BF|nr:ABC transporter substrate-binding protein [Petrotoga sp. 9PW.55.5.1]RAO98540.1 ABC transporter substrate-binding protein [Petrotoga sp. 9PW.55.5.1]